MLYAFVVTLREGLEAALILGILLAYLQKLGRREGARPIWAGTLAALAVSLLGGLLLHGLAGELSGKLLDLFEGLTMLVAVAILSYMILWMQRQARHLQVELHQRVDQALAAGSRVALAVVAFTVVGREGIETALFLVAGSLKSESGLFYALAGIAGAVIAVLLGYLLYQGTVRLNLRVFFTVTGVLLIVFAAGLLSNGLKELQEVGAVPTLIPHVWDTYDLLQDNTEAGRLLAALFGYDASPSLLQVLTYVAYLASFLTYYLQDIIGRPRRAPSLA
ncbi:MAG: hypothetical protein C4289_14830 [Chloroflexota bacterium]